jgi:hypothetical protein
MHDMKMKQKLVNSEYVCVRNIGVDKLDIKHECIKYGACVLFS